MTTRVLVVGDYIQDVYKWCSSSRLCPEAPVPVLVVESSETRPGGVGNVWANLTSLLVGNVEIPKMDLSVSIKTRYFVGHHMMFREDNDTTKVELPETALARLRELSLERFDAIVISDYGKGGITPEVADFLVKSDALCFVDAKGHDVEEKYKGSYCIFPNEHEHLKLNSTLFGNIIRKLGPKGSLVNSQHVKTREQQVYDVTGAGDVFLAAFVARYFTHYKLFDSDQSLLVECARYANAAAGESVRHLGTCVVSPKDFDR